MAYRKKYKSRSKRTYSKKRTYKPRRTRARTFKKKAPGVKILTNQLRQKRKEVMSLDADMISKIVQKELKKVNKE